MKKYIVILIFALGFIACKDKTDKAREIVDKSIEAHGGKSYEKFTTEFDFRKFHIKLMQNEGKFQYERISKDSANNEVWDILNNEGFLRIINGNQVTLSEKDITKYTNAVNSVAYFVLLPHKLKDKAVNLEYLGETEIDKQKYDKVKVWFDKEGGGKDFEDVYCYWFNQKTHLVDYLAYANGGPRFRRVKNRKTVGGIVFQDYENFAITDTTIQAQEYDKAFIAGKDSLLSLIEQKNIAVK
ncbi:MAG: DUF6503 family protein [Emticicia sp.]|nr:DUF6503 family protein [Emticicia sp.]